MPGSNGDLRLAAADGALANRTRRAVFLCYHSIHSDGPPYISLRPEAFEAQLRVLDDRGYLTGARAELDDLAAGRRPPAPLAFLTFDDGYADNHEVALPLMRRHGARATIFVLPGQIGRGTLDWAEAREYAAEHPRAMRGLSWAQVEELAEAGMTIGSHTNRHLHLTELGDEELGEELLDSRRILTERLGCCDVLAYPYGEWDLRVALAAAAAGYAYAFSLPPSRRPTTTPMSIPRISVDHRDTAARFAAKLSPGVRRLICSPAVGRLRLARIRLREWRS